MTLKHFCIPLDKYSPIYISSLSLHLTSLFLDPTRSIKTFADFPQRQIRENNVGDGIIPNKTIKVHHLPLTRVRMFKQVLGYTMTDAELDIERQ